MKFSQWLALAALMAAGVLFWSLREVLIHLFAGVVLAMALCTLVGELRFADVAVRVAPQGKKISKCCLTMGKNF